MNGWWTEVKDDSFKLEPVSPSEKEHSFAFSRCSSTGSINTLSSSAHNTGKKTTIMDYVLYRIELGRVRNVRW